MTGNAWAAEEIVQDVFMTLMRDTKKYDASRGTLGAFLYGVARNRVMKHLERLPREVALEEKQEDGRDRVLFCKRIHTGDVARKAREIGTCKSRCFELPTEFRKLLFSVNWKRRVTKKRHN